MDLAVYKKQSQKKIAAAEKQLKEKCKSDPDYKKLYNATAALKTRLNKRLREEEQWDSDTLVRQESEVGENAKDRMRQLVDILANKMSLQSQTKLLQKLRVDAKRDMQTAFTKQSCSYLGCQV